MRLMTSLFALGLVAWAMPAYAFLDPPYVMPAHPTPEDTVSVNAYRGQCDVLNIGIVPPAIEQHGTEIAILFTGIHEEDPEFCDYGIGTETYPLGRFSPGSYTLQVQWRYGTFNGWMTQTLGTIPFSVAAEPPRPSLAAPTLSIVGLWVLLAGLAAIAVPKLWNR